MNFRREETYFTQQGGPGYDTTIEIWETLYRVRIPQQGSRTVEDIKLRGTVVSGIKQIDDDIKNRLITVMISIDRMIEYYKEDVPVYVCNHDDTKRIYDAISNHIQMWKNHMEKGLNVGNAPLEDLLIMDEFANTVYEHAKYHFRDGSYDNFIANHLRGIQHIGVHNFFNKSVAEKLRTTAKNVTVENNGDVIINGGDEIPQRDSFGDFFKERLMNSRFKG